MSNVVALGFKDEASADAFMAKVQKMQDEDLLEIDDSVRVTVGENGEAKIHKSGSLVSGGAVLGGFVGAVVGTLFLAPVAGAALGAAGGAAIGGMSGDYGIDKDFVKQTSELLKPGTVALFFMVDKTVPDKIEAELKGTDAKLIRTTLTPETQAQLESALSDTGAKS